MASMNTTQRSSLSIALLAPLLAACAGSAASPALEQVQTHDVRALLPRLLDDAARRTGVAPALLRVARIEAVTWPDGALGCPQPGRLYPQSLVPGWRIRIEAPTMALSYHASRRGGWTWCAPGQATPALPATPDAQT